MRTVILAASIVLLGAVAIGCEEPKNPYDVSVDQRSTGLGIPNRVDRISKRVRAQEEEANKTIGALSTAADKVQDPTDWIAVLEIVEAADAAGKDGAYAANIRELKIAQDFIEDEKEEIQKKIGGSVDYVVKQKGCEVDAWGAVNNGFNKAIEERVEERLKENNDAFLVIERNEESLGKKNLPALEDTAIEIAHASYIVHSAMPEAKLELEAMITASADARGEIEAMLEDEKQPRRQGSKSNPDMDKRKLERVKHAEQQLRELERAENDAKSNLEDLEQRTTALQQSYDEALAKLKDAIKAKQPA